MAEPLPEPRPPGAKARIRWRIVSLLFLPHTINRVDRIALPVGLRELT